MASMNTNLNYPGGAPVVELRGRPRVVQRLNGSPAPKYAPGARVERGESLSGESGGATAVTISLAERLGASPKDVEKLLNRPIGSQFATGDEIAKVRKGFRGQSVVAPFTGILKSYNPESGIALFMSSAPSESSALVSGVVEAVGVDSIAIRVAGSRAFGIAGFGAPASGPIRFISTDVNHVPSPNEVSESMRGAVVVAGPWASAPVYRKLFEARVAAVITGGFVESEIAAALGWASDQRLAAWQDAGGRIPAEMAVVATEGFGKLPINPAIWSMLREYDGKPAIVLPQTVLAGDLARPQIVIEDPAAAGMATPRAMAPGAMLRLVDPANLGAVVEAASTPLKAREESGRLIDVIDVRWPNGKTQTVRLDSVELVA
jgi:hypothetical protein